MAKASKRLSPLIASVESISFIGFSDDSDNLIVPLFLWKKLASFETRPSSKVKDKSSTEELNDWLMDSLKKANIGKEGERRQSPTIAELSRNLFFTGKGRKSGAFGVFFQTLRENR